MAQAPPNSPAKGSNPLEHDDQVLEQKPEAPKAAQKVELDLDDAPFLSDASPEGPEGPLPEEPARLEKTMDAAGLDGKDQDHSSAKTVFALAVVVLLLLAGGLAFWLSGTGTETETLPLPPPPPPLEAEDPKPQEHFVELDPFLVAFDQDQEVRFLTLQLSLVTDDLVFSLEVQRKTIILRDAVYYFLNNRPLPIVKRVEAAEMLKEDLLSVFNQHLSRPLNGVLIEEYVVH